MLNPTIFVFEYGSLRRQIWSRWIVVCRAITSQVRATLSIISSCQWQYWANTSTYPVLSSPVMYALLSRVFRIYSRCTWSWDKKKFGSFRSVCAYTALFERPQQQRMKITHFQWRKNATDRLFEWVHMTRHHLLCYCWNYLPQMAPVRYDHPEWSKRSCETAGRVM